MTATSCIMALIIEVFLIKLGCYLLGIGSEIHFLDFFSYSAYKFCILIVSISASIFGKAIKYCVFGYSVVAYGFFLVKVGDGKFMLVMFLDSIFKARLCSRKCKCSCAQSTTQKNQFPVVRSWLRAISLLFAFKIN